MSASSPEPVLRVLGLEKRYGKTPALDGISFSLAAGEVAAVLGPNGAGKTTLLQLAAGILFPSAGHVTVFGLHRWRDSFDIRKRSTIALAEPVFGGSPTPYEYLRFLAQIYGLKKSEFLDRLKALAADVAMTPHLHKRWGELSLGMRKKAALVGAFLPVEGIGLRLLDEPLAGGVDPTGMEALAAWVAQARERGEAVLFTTQLLDQAELSATRVLILDRGQLLADGSVAEVAAQAGIPPEEPRRLAKAFGALVRNHPEEAPGEDEEEAKGEEP